MNFSSRALFCVALISLAIPFSGNAARNEFLTYYCPAVNDKYEGGPLTMLGSKVVTLEESGRTGILPTAASWLNFAGKCNNHYKTSRSAPRCVVQIKIAGIRTLPGYRNHVAKFKSKYPALCETCDTIVAVVEDTGGPFNRQNKKNPRLMFDLAMDSRKHCYRGGGFRTDKVDWNIAGYVPGSSRPKYYSKRN